ncbi:hypothetical protein EB796_008814 [Bugula neritina]|uniref:C2H2-type domain-containing protein n=1 Tax=Bugula neritina TaxID=10212 RepID=A0A7J7K4L1_BUGNE|nr:hypothetical protein EB796_008814 [Bugula neritina]
MSGLTELEFLRSSGVQSNSTLLDTTQLAITGASMPSGLVWDNDTLPSQPTSPLLLFTEDELPELLHRRWHWVKPATDHKMQAAWGSKNNTVCQLCRETITSTRELKRHVDKHYTMIFCPS